MSRQISPIVCDGPGCGAHKREANRWWTVELRGEAILILPRTFANDDAGRYEFCGEACVLKFISQEMAKVTS